MDNDGSSRAFEISLQTMETFLEGCGFGFGVRGQMPFVVLANAV